MSELWTRGKNYVFTFGVFFFLFILYGILVKTQPFTNVLFASDFLHFVVLLKHCWFGFEIMQKMMTMCYELQKMKNNYRITFLCMHSATCWLMLHSECRSASSKNCTAQMSHACRHSHLFLNTQFLDSKCAVDHCRLYKRN